MRLMTTATLLVALVGCTGAHLDPTDPAADAPSAGAEDPSDDGVVDTDGLIEEEEQEEEEEEQEEQEEQEEEPEDEPDCGPEDAPKAEVWLCVEGMT